MRRLIVYHFIFRSHPYDLRISHVKLGLEILSRAVLRITLFFQSMAFAKIHKVVSLSMIVQKFRNLSSFFVGKT